MIAHERRLALLGWLRQRGSVSGAEAAARFGVSLRTLRRDLAELRAQGHPIDGDPGPGGGVRLAADARPAAVDFDVDEAVGLYLSLHLARASGTLPFAEGAQRALDKIAAALRPERAAALRRLLRRIVVGVPASPTVIASLGPVSPRLLAVFETSFRQQCAMGFGYVDREGRSSRRRAEPHGLLVQAPAWYLLAFDLDKRSERMFRLDRMRRPRTLGTSTFTPRPLHVFDALVAPEALARR